MSPRPKKQTPPAPVAPSPALDLAPGLSLPLQAVTETFAILAKRRVGKSNAAVVMAEEFYDHGLPWVAIDPKGDWWGIRASGDGDAPGLAVTVFGGRHGDLPLEPAAGRLVADLVVEERLTCVLDISEMDDPDQQRFLLAFAKRLYEINTEPLHVFCEEADDYISQNARGDELDVVRAFTRLVKRGGFRGIGVTLITQRSALLHKNVLTQAEGLIALRTSAPSDRKVIADWVSGNVDGASIAADLPSLGQGEAWVIAPHLLGDPTRIQFRRRRTFDSGATPTVGATAVAPRHLAPVDLERLSVAMAATIEKASAEDPDVLRGRIADLERDLRSARSPRKAPTGTSTGQPVERVVERVEVEKVVQVPVLTGEQAQAVLDAAEKVRVYAANACERNEMAVVEIRTEVARLDALLAVPVGLLTTEPAGGAGRPSDGGARSRKVRAVPAAPPAAPRSTPRSAQSPPQSPPQSPAQVSAQSPAQVSARVSDESLPRGQRLILAALAQHGTLTINQVAMITGYRHTSGGFKNYLSQLRTAGWIDGSGTGTASITAEGRDALGDYDPLPTGDALLQWWLNRGKPLGLAERTILTVLRDAHPEHVSTADLAAKSGYSATSGGFKNALSRLRTLGLASGRNGLVLSDDLVD